MRWATRWAWICEFMTAMLRRLRPSRQAPKVASSTPSASRRSRRVRTSARAPHGDSHHGREPRIARSRRMCFFSRPAGLCRLAGLTARRSVRAIEQLSGRCTERLLASELISDPGPGRSGDLRRPPSRGTSSSPSSVDHVSPTNLRTIVVTGRPSPWTRRIRSRRYHFEEQPRTRADGASSRRLRHSGQAHSPVAAPSR
jgi:hypothetical protein